MSEFRADPRPGKDHVGVGVGAIVVEGHRVLLLKRRRAPEAGSGASKAARSSSVRACTKR